MVDMVHPSLCLVRHGETDWNAEGRLQGQKDIALNGRGRAQAEAVGRELLRVRPEIVGFDFVASPLFRTRQTMEIMRGAMGLSVGDYRLDDRLKELTFGSWEGLTWSEVKYRAPREAAAREADKWGFSPPDGGESYALLSARIAQWLASVERPTLAVTHGGVARVLLGLIAGVPNSELSLRNITQGRALMFESGAARWI